MKKINDESPVEEELFINEYQLAELQDFSKFSNEIKLSLGDLSVRYEFAKNNLLSKFNENQVEINKLENKLKEKYGDEIKVDISNGKIVKQ